MKSAEDIRSGKRTKDRDLNPPDEEKIDLFTCSKCGDETPNEDLLCDDCMDEEVSTDQNKKDSL